jgi:putative transposase
VAASTLPPPMPTLTVLFGMLRAALIDRQKLLLENAALRQQVIILKRSVSRPRIEDSDRIFWILMQRFLTDWKSSLLIVTPETVLRWHRKGWAFYWTRKSKPMKRGAPPIGWKLVRLIQRMCVENVTWGAPRIRDELGLLGHEVAQSTVEKYMLKRTDPRRGQRWSTFLANHMTVTAACDFFVVPTLTFKLLYAFVVLSHDRRRIVRVAVTAHPTAEWTAGQIREAFPDEDTLPTYLLHDRDSIYGDRFHEEIRIMGLRELLSGRRSPWQNPFAERVIGSIRRECTDHVIAIGERHLLRLLQEYQSYYNASRSHQSLDGNAPEPRQREASPRRRCERRAGAWWTAPQVPPRGLTRQLGES